MIDTSNPALSYRNLLREVTRAFPPSEDGDGQAEFRLWLESLYETANGDKLTLFVSAVGLLTYGRLEMIFAVLDNLPPSPRNLRRLAWILKALLPMPTALDPLKDIDSVRSWLEQNLAYLYWDEDKGLFTLANS